MAWRRASLQHAYSFSQLDANTGSFSGVKLVSIRIWRFWKVGLTVSAISIFCKMKRAPWTLLDYDNNTCIIYLPHFPQLWIKVCSNALYSNDSERNTVYELLKPRRETQLAKTTSWLFTEQDRLDVWMGDRSDKYPSQGGIRHAKTTTPWPLSSGTSSLSHELHNTIHNIEVERPVSYTHLTLPTKLEV